MASIEEALQIAHAHQQAGRLAEAWVISAQILNSVTDHPEALHLAGVIAFGLGKHEFAAESIERAIALSPGVAQFHRNLGAVYAAEGRLEAAVACFRHALILRPAYADASSSMGRALRGLGRLDDAATYLRRGVTMQPDDAKACNDLGVVMQELGRLVDAANWYERAIRIDAGYAEAMSNLGLALTHLGQIEPAVSLLRRALEFKPGFAEAQGNLGIALKQQGRLDEAVASFRQSLVLDSRSADTHRELGSTLKDQGLTKEARVCFQNALEITPSDSLRLLIAATLPVIYESAAHLLEVRQELETELSAFLDQPISITDPIREIRSTNFYLAYQGLDDRPIQETFSRLYLKACPSLHYDCARRRPSRPDGKISVGFVSSHLYNHTIGTLTAGIVEQLSRNRFVVTVFSASHKDDEMSRRIAGSADRRIVLSQHSLEHMREQITREAPDVLFYPDIGMDPLTYLLAFSRLAPVQCVTWGHPVTTGHSTIDYFLSSTHLEPDDAEAHYSERLVRLRDLPAYYFRPELPRPARSRKELGIDKARTLYLCPQSLFKLHPDFDEMIAGILRADSGGEVILVQGHYAQLTRLICARFQRTIPDLVDRIRFVPRLSRADFLGLLAEADVVLDPVHFGGGSTTYEALAFGTPIVTLPGRYMRGRVTLGCYRQIGVLDCVAANVKDYVEIAVRLGTDSAYRANIKSRILAANAALYENASVVREIEEFLAQAIARSQS